MKGYTVADRLFGMAVACAFCAQVTGDYRSCGVVFGALAASCLFVAGVYAALDRWAS